MNFKTKASSSIDALYRNCQIRAMRITPVTGSAFFGMHNRGLLLVVYESQHAGWAELDAQPAAFAPHPKDDHPTARPASGARGWLSGCLFCQDLWHIAP